MHCRVRGAVALLLICLPIADLRNCTCGQEGQVSRVINGRKTAIGHFPWVVRVMRDVPRARSYCTGSLISNTFVLTAAHCVPRSRDPSAVRVIIGQQCGYTGYRENDTTWRESEVMRVIRNKRYVDHWHVGNDVALLELRIPLPMDHDFMPACLSDFQLFDNFLVVGWGNVNNGSRIIHSDCLNEADLDIVPHRTCRWTHPYANMNYVVCAGGKKSNICNGDSGGPLMTRKFGRIFQAGITSFMRRGCLSGRPAAFERISPHLPWIMRNTKNSICLP